jgi:hypothetical protein
MEDVLTTYAKPYDPTHPKVCLDEKIVYLISSRRDNLPMKPGAAEKQDFEYQREGSANLFVIIEPQRGWRHVLVRTQRTAKDYAEVIRWLVDEAYPDAVQIEVVQDNLNTHCPAALYQTFPPQEARRLLNKLKFTYTPKHGSWLNMAELEISVFERTCLDRRIGSREILEREVAALEAERNKAKATINWQFTCEMARVTLQRLYPKLSQEPALQECSE